MSGRIAFVFPGQGSQEVGMGLALAAAYPEAAAALAEATHRRWFVVRHHYSKGIAGGTT